jgi:MFS family permease
LSHLQIPGYFYVIFTLERPSFGRKRSLCGFLILSGVSLFLYPIVPKSMPWLAVSLSVFGRFCANCSYTTLHMFTAEQFPTVVRGIGMGYSYVVSR